MHYRDQELGSDMAHSAKTLAEGLGWFSIALGLAELFAPRTLTATLGADDHSTLVRAYGLREIGTGIGILASDDPTPWVWGRVAGDVLDLATLAPTLSRDNPRRAYAIAAFGNVAAVTALDLFCALALSAEPRRMLPVRDYSDRSGLPYPPDRMRGIARRGRPIGTAAEPTEQAAEN
jgi:hypothetical protein